MPSARLNTAAAAPIPIASEATAASVNAGERRSSRAPNREVLQQGVERTERPHVACLLTDRGDVAEHPLRFPSRLARVHALVDQAAVAAARCAPAISSRSSSSQAVAA